MDFTVNYDYTMMDNELVGKITINNFDVIVDLNDLFKIINSPKKFTRYKEGQLLPYFKRNNQEISYREFLYEYNPVNINYFYKNGNDIDLRRSNIEIYHNYHQFMIENYNVISYFKGHFTKNGKDAFVMKNPIWKIRVGNKELLKMYCENNTLITLCETSYQKILDSEKNNKHTFFMHSNGYVCSSSGLFIHQIITGCYGNGKGTKNISVDHIDQDPLNNTFENLRLASQKEQQENSNGIKEGTKRARKTNARELPNGITQEMIPKYVYYCKECYNKEKQLYREFFRIEKHPNMKTKQIAGSKSMKLSISDKLEQIKEKLAALN